MLKLQGSQGEGDRTRQKLLRRNGWSRRERICQRDSDEKNNSPTGHDTEWEMIGGRNDAEKKHPGDDRQNGLRDVFSAGGSACGRIRGRTSRESKDSANTAERLSSMKAEGGVEAPAKACSWAKKTCPGGYARVLVD